MLDWSKGDIVYQQGRADIIAGPAKCSPMADGAPKPGTAEDAEAELHAHIIEALRDVLTLRKLAGEEAARAAPYCHPRMGNAANDDGRDEEVPLAERLAYYARRDDIAAAGGKVVELKP